MPYKIFDTPFGQYIYERNANLIIKLPTKENSQTIDTFLPTLGISTENVLEEIRHPSSWIIGDILRSHVYNMVLQVTQGCNLRCGYCAYSGNYYNRTHTSKKMPYNVAKHAVDFLFEHSSECSEIVIGFYGGEPLLEFDLIKRIVQYTEQIGWGKSIRYVITTNATLLKGEILDFLACHNFSVMVSFDGPREVHDKNRRFVDGRGSYDLIIENLKIAKQKYPNFYNTFMTNTVLSPNEDYDFIKNFFNEDSIIHALYSRVSLISAEDAKVPITYGEKLAISERAEFIKILLYFLGKIRKESISKIYLNRINGIVQYFDTINLNGIKGNLAAHPAGPCVPGQKRFFVDVNGDFYPCEKISECSNAKIGSLSTGFDIDSIINMVNIGEITQEECKNCWAFLWCNQCINFSFQHNTVSRTKRLSNCANSKNHAIHALRTIVFLKAYGFDIERWKLDNAIDDFLRE